MSGASDRKRAAEETADRVRAAILRGEIEPGSALPAERELSEKLGVSRLTLRSAIARLETEGLVRPVHGSGTRVLDYRERGGVDLIGYLAAQAIEGGQVPSALLSELLELRRMIAIELVGLAAERATDEELAELRRHHRRQSTLLDDPEAFKRADLAFARLLIRAGHNFALELLFNSVVRVIESNPSLTLAFQANATQTLEVYDRILELIESRDPRRAAKVTRRLLEFLDGRTLALLDVMAPAQSEVAQ
jgi:DNA-binding FadR family transcriptional regulator